MSRTARVERITKETKVLVEIDLDGTGAAEISTGVGFYDHMLHQIARHGGFDLTVRTVGDLEIDAHHTIEDTALALGAAFDQALGDKAGIRRYGSATVPMDEVLVRAAVDLSGRPYVVHDEPVLAPYIGPVYATSMTRHIWESFGQAARVTLHVDVLRAARPGGHPDAHHVVEAQFKAVSRALREATSIDSAFGRGDPEHEGRCSDGWRVAGRCSDPGRGAGGRHLVALPAGCAEGRRAGHRGARGARHGRRGAVAAAGERVIGASTDVSPPRRGARLRLGQPAFGGAGAGRRRGGRPVTDDLAAAAAADGLVVPGVGAYAACMAGIEALGAGPVIAERVAAGRPVLGICVGMQVLFEHGDEHGVVTKGLGLLPGGVTRLAAARLPHMGWNTVRAPRESVLFAGLHAAEPVLFRPLVRHG